MTTFVPIRRTDADGTIVVATCPEGAVDHWKTKGWEPADPTEADTSDDSTPLPGVGDESTGGDTPDTDSTLARGQSDG